MSITQQTAAIAQVRSAIAKQIDTRSHAISCRADGGRLTVYICPMPLGCQRWTPSRFIRDHGEAIAMEARLSGFHSTEIKCAVNEFETFRF